MRKKNHLFLLMSLISASLLVSVFTIVQAQNPGASAVKATKWSDPATWPDGKVPRRRRGDHRRRQGIVLDVSPPALRSLTINGKLSFSNERDMELKTEWIYLPRRRARHRQRGQAPYAQGHDHPDRQRQGREHQHHGRPWASCS